MRRIVYNLILVTGGFISLLLLTAIYYLPPQLDEYPVEGLAVLGIFLGLAMANVFYTAGWIVEIFVLKFGGDWSVKFGPSLLKTGILFSLFVVSLPTLAHFFYWIIRLVALAAPKNNIPLALWR
ncbi:MAG: hypothetical protein IPH75_07215 [bacterium]|nr:hypothetical protein [bacterium]